MESASEIKSVFWIGTTVMILLAIGLLFMATFYQRHFAKMKQKEAELLLKASLKSEKKERQRIAKDLHDSVQGDLGAVRNYFTLLSIKVKEPESLDLIREIKGAIEKTIEHARLISYNLMPPLLQNAGFCAAISEYFDGLSKSSGKIFSIEVGSSNLSLPNENSYELFRIVQEFTSNMLKYGSINECKLLLSDTDKEIKLEIIDDGNSFNFKESYALSKGSGLYNIQSRLTSIDAKLEQLKVDKGNHFTLYLNKKYD